MGVKSVQISSTGFIPNTSGLGLNVKQQLPTFILIETNDPLATVLVSGYLTESHTAFGYPYNNKQMALVATLESGNVYQTQWLAVSVTGTAPNYVYSLVGTTDVGTVFQAAAGTAAAPSYTFSGDLDTGMYHPSANTVGFSAGGSLIASVATTGLAVTGLISATTTVTGLTGLVSGASGTAGLVSVFPAVGAGTLRLAAVSNGTSNTTISNVAGAQSTVYSIPDVVAATGQFIVKTAAFVSGNFPQNSGTAGLVIDSGVAVAALQLKANIKVASTADIGGGGAGPISVVLAGVTSASKIVATIASSSNVVAVGKCICTATGFDITFTGDPGAACIVNYVIGVVAQ
jgi:hypothetical protein